MRPRGGYRPSRCLLLLAAAGAVASASGLDEYSAGFLLAAASLTGLLVRVIAGWLVGRSGSDGLRPVAVLMALGTIGILLLATQQPVLVVPGALVAFGAAWGWPGLFFYSVTSSHMDAPGRATSVAHLGIADGGTVGGFLFGTTADHFGYPVAWCVAAALMVAASLMVVRAVRLVKSSAEVRRDSL